MSERLTKKVDSCKGLPSYCEPPHIEEYSTKNKRQAVNKLGKLEDFEDKFGCSLEIVLKALTEGIYDKRRYYIGSCISLSNGNTGLYIDSLDRLFLFEDHGKTWALTKEELQ